MIPTTGYMIQLSSRIIMHEAYICVFNSQTFLCMSPCITKQDTLTPFHFIDKHT